MHEQHLTMEAWMLSNSLYLELNNTNTTKERAKRLEPIYAKALTRYYRRKSKYDKLIRQ
jgi:hypothetical protein